MNTPIPLNNNFSLSTIPTPLIDLITIRYSLSTSPILSKSDIGNILEEIFEDNQIKRIKREKEKIFKWEPFAHINAQFRNDSYFSHNITSLVIIIPLVTLTNYVIDNLNSFKSVFPSNIDLTMPTEPFYSFEASIEEKKNLPFKIDKQYQELQFQILCILQDYFKSKYDSILIQIQNISQLPIQFDSIKSAIQYIEISFPYVIPAKEFSTNILFDFTKTIPFDFLRSDYGTDIDFATYRSDSGKLEYIKIYVFGYEYKKEEEIKKKKKKKRQKEKIGFKVEFAVKIDKIDQILRTNKSIPHTLDELRNHLQPLIDKYQKDLSDSIYKINHKRSYPQKELYLKLGECRAKTKELVYRDVIEHLENEQKVKRVKKGEKENDNFIERLEGKNVLERTSQITGIYKLTNQYYPYTTKKSGDKNDRSKK